MLCSTFGVTFLGLRLTFCFPIYAKEPVNISSVYVWTIFIIS